MPEHLRTKEPGSTTVIPTTGRLPWYNADGQVRQPYLVGLAGGSASGKTTVATRIIRNLGVPWVALISMDNFYKSLTKEQMDLAHHNQYNFDHPDAFDWEKLFQVLQDLKRGLKVDVPIYDFKTHSRLEKTTTIYGANVVLFEGIFALWDKDVRSLMDLKLFVDTDSDIRLARRCTSLLSKPAF
jgi:uridine kinase